MMSLNNCHSRTIMFTVFTARLVCSRRTFKVPVVHFTAKERKKARTRRIKVSFSDWRLKNVNF